MGGIILTREEIKETAIISYMITFGREPREGELDERIKEIEKILETDRVNEHE